MTKIKNIIKSVLPDWMFWNLSCLLFGNKTMWSGEYSTWAEADFKTEGYDAESILDQIKPAALKVKHGVELNEKEKIKFNVSIYSEDILSILQKNIDENNGILNIIDFGGSLGITYFQHRKLLKNVKEIKWNIIEQKHFADYGNADISNNELKFYYDVDEVLKDNKPTLFLASGVLQYLENPHIFLENLLKYDFHYLIFDKTAFIEGEDRLTIQKVDERIYKGSYPAWFLNEYKIRRLICDKYEIINTFNGYVIRYFLSKKAYHKGLTFKIKK